MGDVLSPEEIEKMLSNAGQIDEAPADDGGKAAADDSGGVPAAGGGKAAPVSFVTDDYINKDEQDVLGEVANMCMGTSATTMSTLLSKRVDITTPMVSIQSMRTLRAQYPAPLVVAEVKYIEGINGDNLLILKEFDVALITNVLLGESADIDPDNIDLTDIHMSAMNEVMNQMVGSSATSLADILNRMVNISTPTTKRLEMDGEQIVGSFEDPDEPFVRISFKMDIEDLLSSEIMQIMSLDLAKGMVNDIMQDMSSEAPVAAAEPVPAPAAAPQAPQPAPAPAAAQQPRVAPAMQPQYQQPYPQQQPNVIMPTQNVNVQEPRFPSFNAPERVEGVENINMILDVPMHVTVELGKTKQKIKDILAYNMGSVIVLDKVAGEAVDILVNGKRIGRGEVVVIDDNYGVRITEIHSFTAEELL